MYITCYHSTPGLCGEFDSASPGHPGTRRLAKVPPHFPAVPAGHRGNSAVFGRHRRHHLLVLPGQNEEKHEGHEETEEPDGHFGVQSC